MTPAGLGLMKLPSLGSSAFDTQNPISTAACDTLTDRRRASITDPCLHAHSTLNQVNPLSNSQQSTHDQRNYTLPSFRELSRHSKDSRFISQTPNTLQPLYHSLDHVSTDPAAARRRGSAADLDHILLNCNSDFDPLHRQPINAHPVSPTQTNLSLSDQQVNHSPLSHPSQPYSFNSFSFDSTTLPSVHLPSHQTNTPVSPRSFSSVPLTNQSEPNFLPLGSSVNRRPNSVRRRSSRVNDVDATQSEDPARAPMNGQASNLNGSDHPRALPTPAGSQWPYPSHHQRHHLQKPSAPVKRRGSSQSIPESNAVPANSVSIPPDQSYGTVDQPWNAFRFMSNNSQRETVAGDTPSILRNYRLDARRQSEASSSSSTGLSHDRRQSGESGEGDDTDDNHNLPPIHSLRRRSWSSCSKQNIPPFSPNQSAVSACTSDYALPPLPFKEQIGPSSAFANSAAVEHVVLADNRGWYNSLEEQSAVRCGGGVEDVYEIKDKLEATRLLDRLPIHSNAVPELTLPGGPGLGQVNQQDKPCNPYSRSPELKISHKLAERKRRKEMRDLFDDLRCALPVGDERHSKVSKWETLSRAVEYMKYLRSENEILKKQNVDLQSKLNLTNGGALNCRQEQNNPK